MKNRKQTQPLNLVVCFNIFLQGVNIMKKLMLCAVGLAMFSNVANAAICKDFDDDMNLVEYECGTSLAAAIKAALSKLVMG